MGIKSKSLFNSLVATFGAIGDASLMELKRDIKSSSGKTRSGYKTAHSNKVKSKRLTKSIVKMKKRKITWKKQYLG